MATNTMDKNEEIWSMVEEGMIYLMAHITKDNGVKIKLMESVLFSLKTEDLSIKANGEMTYIMDGELYMHRQEIGINTRVSLRMVWSKVEEEYSLKTEPYMMASLEVIKSLGEEEK